MMNSLEWVLRRWRWGALGAVLVIALWFVLPDRPVRYPPGVATPDEPLQDNLTMGPAWVRDEYTIVGIANFELEAKVLGKERYWLDREADLCPLDLALGWGPMSDQAVVDEIDIEQSGRWYRWTSDTMPITAAQIVRHSANMHIIPADDTVFSAVKRVRVGELIGLRGFLVKVDAADGWSWRSSLTRTDTGDGSCEVMWVENAYQVRFEPER